MSHTLNVLKKNLDQLTEAADLVLPKVVVNELRTMLAKPLCDVLAEFDDRLSTLERENDGQR